MAKRASLRSVPKTWPRWLRLARAYLGDLRRRDPAAYRGIRGRAAENWRDLEPLWQRLADEHSRALGKTWPRWGAATAYGDTGGVLALVFESVARWAADDRKRVADIRAAAARVIELQSGIDEAIDKLCDAVTECRDLCTRHQIKVDAPYWVDDLGEALGELAHRFVRWGQEPEVAASIALQRKIGYGPQPGVLDLVRAARSCRVLHSDVSSTPMRNLWTREWLRTVTPEVRAADPLAREALGAKTGSAATSDAAQLRALFAGLAVLTERNGIGTDAPGPLDWLTPADLSALAQVFAGNDDEGRDPRRPHGARAERFDVDNVRKALRSFRQADKPDAEG